MKSNPLYRAVVIILILAATIGLDQISKTVVRKKIADYQVVNVIKNKVVLEKVENTGAFLSMGDNVSKPVRLIFLNAIPLILVLLALGYIFVKPVNTTPLIAIIFMVGGGLGNLYDRIAHGSVTDFIYIDLGGMLHTGVFNVADMFITAGISMILIQSWFKKKPHDEPISEETDTQLDQLETGHTHAASEPDVEARD